MPRERESHVSIGRNARSGRKDKLHPHQLLTYLLLAGIFMVFSVLMLAFSGAQLYTVKEVGARMPKTFWYSTGILLLSSYTIWLAAAAQQKERYKSTTAWLGVTAALGILFMAVQLIGWNELHMQGIYLNGAAAGSYIYVISGLHLLHLAAAIGFTLLVLTHALKASIDAVSALVYSTDNYRQQQMHMLSTFWHFLGALWLVMFLVFLVLLER